MNKFIKEKFININLVTTMQLLLFTLLITIPSSSGGLGINFGDNIKTNTNSIGVNFENPSSSENGFHIYINGSSYNNINHNITLGDVDNVEFTIIPGNKFIFGETFT